MSSFQDHTNGSLFVETGIKRNNTWVSQVDGNNTGFFHVIRVENGSTVPRDVKIVGNLPQGTRRLIFVGQPAQDKWEDTLSAIQNMSSDQGQCEIQVTSKNNPTQGDERVQCLSVEYKDHWNATWQQCAKNLPLGFKVSVT